MSSLYKISVPISPEAEAATVGLLEKMFRTTPCVETDLENNTTQVTVFVTKAPARAKLKAALGRFSLRKLPPENWAESWKRHFKPIEIGSKLLIKPGWSKRKPKRDQAVVVLDPGLSFGTGQHPTTQFCLQQLVRFRRAGEAQSFLDVGTGSGILAIAAAKLGYAPVYAYDSDPAAVRIARTNAASNGVAANLRLIERDLAEDETPDRFDLICANLLADVLLAERERLINRLKTAGRLVLAGILRLQFREIQDAYERAGLRLVASRLGNEWKSGAFERAAEISAK